MKSLWPYLSAFALVLAGAVAALVHALGGGAYPIFSLGAAIGCIIIGQLVLMGLALRQDDSRDSGLNQVIHNAAGFHSEIRRKTENFQAQVDILRNQAQAQTAALVKGINDLQASYGHLHSMLMPESRVANDGAHRPASAPQHMMDEPSVEAAHGRRGRQSANMAEPSEDTSFVDQINFALEPVVNIFTSRTAHYRMHLTMQVSHEELSYRQLLEWADRSGKRSIIDLLAAREALDLLFRLRQRDPDLSLFVNIGAESLSNPETIYRLLELRQAAGNVAKGLVFELPHDMLAGLSEQALEGLAALARDGAFFALSQISVHALDLQSMNILNVRYVLLAAASIDSFGPNSSLVGFAQMARLAHINLIITGLADSELIPGLQNITRLACGPCFAEPRRVKRRQPAPDDISLAA